MLVTVGLSVFDILPSLSTTIYVHSLIDSSSFFVFFPLLLAGVYLYKFKPYNLSGLIMRKKIDKFYT